MPIYRKPSFWGGILASLALACLVFFIVNAMIEDNKQAPGDHPTPTQNIEQPDKTPEQSPANTPLENSPPQTNSPEPAAPLFTFTRIDRLDIDEERNSQIFLLSQAESNTLNALLRTGEWTEATDVPAMGIDPPYLFYEESGDYLSVNRWDDSRCLIVRRYINDIDRIDLYYAPESVMDSVLTFMSECAPLPGKYNNDSAWYFNLFRADTAFNTLINLPKNDDRPFSDAALAAYAVFRMGEDYSYEKGNTKEEYDAVTQKYFGMKITNFDNGMTEFIPGTDRIRATGWSFNSSVFMVLKSAVTDNQDGTSTADFYAYDISDAFWDDQNRQYLENVKEYLLTGNDEPYPKPFVVRVVYEIKTEMRDGKQESYLAYKSVTTLP